MATMIDGEPYLGQVLVRPLRKKVINYLLVAGKVPEEQNGRTDFWSRRKGEEVIRYDPHGPRGHWHKGGYDKLGAGGSHVNFLTM
ncbi:MAG: hypothetical protein Ct9H300mP11_04920 [Chloroflexota bacterium]|nr:MAG: hypothetical protein Ct9H300mP11_04920 [Chloroflexota bacterium]